MTIWDSDCPHVPRSILRDCLLPIVVSILVPVQKRLTMSMGMLLMSPVTTMAQVQQVPKNSPEPSEPSPEPR